MLAIGQEMLGIMATVTRQEHGVSLVSETGSKTDSLESKPADTDFPKFGTKCVRAWGDWGDEPAQ